MEKVYHLYAKDKELFSGTKEKEFKSMVSTVKGMVGLMKTDYVEEDLHIEITEEK